MALEKNQVHFYHHFYPIKF